MRERFTGENGATYTVCDEFTAPATSGRPHVHVEHVDHETRVIVGGYNGVRFESADEATRWAKADARLTLAPGQPAYVRQVVTV